MLHTNKTRDGYEKRIAVRRTVWTCPIKVEPYNFWVSFGILSCVELPSFTVESSDCAKKKKKRPVAADLYWTM